MEPFSVLMGERPNILTFISHFCFSLLLVWRPCYIQIPSVHPISVWNQRSFPFLPLKSLNFGHPSTWENGEAYCNGLVTLSPGRRMGRVYGVRDGCWVSLKSQSKCYWNAFLCRFGIVWVWRGMQCQESLCCVFKYTVSSRDLLLSLSHHKLVRSFSQACQSEEVQGFCFAGVRMQGWLCSIVGFSGFACCSMSKKVENLLQAAIF